MSTDAPLTLTLDGLHPADVARVRRALDMAMQNVEMRARYRELRRQGREKPAALCLLADAYHLSEDAVNRRLWPRG